MAMYDDYGGEDEETRRQRREQTPQLPGQPEQGRGPGTIFDPEYRRTGFGSPESGYGPGGVDNPAYTGGAGTPAQPVKQADSITFGSRITNTDTAPPPKFQEPQAQSFAAAQGPAPAAAPGIKQPGITDEVTKILMSQLNDLKNPGDLNNDPTYQAAVRAYQIGQLRSADKQRKALAERTAATTGTTSAGGFNVGVRGIQERAGENAAQYKSGLALDRLQAREAQLADAIKMARAVGQDDIANQLELQRLQLQTELGRGDLALRGELGRGQLGLGYDNLGFNYADMVQRANRDAVLAALGGGGG